ncbi:MAG: hypothetical protein V4610_14830 [Pseudomonadota bacterium]|jgi:hypothetical protein
MQNEDETRVPTGDDLFEHPAELASGEDGTPLGVGASKGNSGTDAQRRRRMEGDDGHDDGGHDDGGRPSGKRTSGTDAQRRRNQ